MKAPDDVTDLGPAGGRASGRLVHDSKAKGTAVNEGKQLERAMRGDMSPRQWRRHIRQRRLADADRRAAELRAAARGQP